MVIPLAQDFGLNDKGSPIVTMLNQPVISEHVELVKRTMAGVSLPAPGVPAWAREISDAQWEDVVQKALQARQASPAWK